MRLLRRRRSKLVAERPLDWALRSPVGILATSAATSRLGSYDVTGAELTDVLKVSLASWVIQDGNYGDFKRGARAAFALTFSAATPLIEVNPRDEPLRSLVHVGDAHYKAVGEVVHVSDEWWVIDVGVMLFREEKPPEFVRRGGWVSGSIDVEIDYYIYFEFLSAEPAAPALIYDWMIESIEMQTAPFVESRPGFWVRDPMRLGWKEVRRTEAWKDDGGHAWYILHCRRVDRPPRRTLRRGWW